MPGNRKLMSVHQTLTAEVHLAGRDDTHYTALCPHLKFFGVMQTSSPVDGDVTDLKVRATSKHGLDSFIFPPVSWKGWQDCCSHVDNQLDSEVPTVRTGCAVATKNAALNRITYCLLVEIMLCQINSLKGQDFCRVFHFDRQSLTKSFALPLIGSHETLLMSLCWCHLVVKLRRSL